MEYAIIVPFRTKMRLLVANLSANFGIFSFLH